MPLISLKVPEKLYALPTYEEFKDKVMENLNKTGTLQHLFGGFVFDKAEDWLKGAISKPGAKLDKWIDDKLKFTSWEIIH